MRGLFHPLEEYAGPFILTVGALCFVLLCCLSSIRCTAYFQCDLDFRILLFRLKMFSCFLTYPATFLRDFFLQFQLVLSVLQFSPNFGSAYEFRYGHSFMKLYLGIFSCVIIII
jgi:hypothetical protein